MVAMPMVHLKVIKVTTSDGAQIDVRVYRPKMLESKSAAAYFYAHGGGAYATRAD